MTHKNRNPARVARAACLTLAGLWVAVAAYAQTDTIDRVFGERVEIDDASQRSQVRVAQLDDEADELFAEYRQALAMTRSLAAYNEQMSVMVASQNDEIATMTAQMEDIENTAREVLPLMNRMLATLEQFVRLDVPFLPEERSNRIAELKQMMARADVTASEKYRRLIEAYLIETDFGRTIEAYDGKLADRTVQFLRVGRVALLYQTLDGEETGYWDADNKAWVVDNGYGSEMANGLAIAKKQSAPDFLFVPIAAPKELQP
ncbi:MAG: DUF3450 domain-containing protein [Gammaproteobacteria bacterium]